LPYRRQRAGEWVRQNQGAAGIDPQTRAEIEAADGPALLVEIAPRRRDKRYRPPPVRRVRIPKGDGKTRPRGIPTVRDRGAQAACQRLREPIFEADLEGCSCGFRPEKGALDAWEAVSQTSRQGYRWGVEADIQPFFDRLEHQQRMTALRRRISEGERLRLLYRGRKAGYLRDGVSHATDPGSPPGGVLPPWLANVSRHGFDEAPQTQKAFLGRWTRDAEDFVIPCGTAEQAVRALEGTREPWAGVGWTRHPAKTRRVNDREVGFDCRGFHHRRGLLTGSQKESRGVWRWPSKKACRQLRAPVRERGGPPGRRRRERGTASRGWDGICRGGSLPSAMGRAPGRS
jgi:RNA-directed DNA polymerase